MPICYPKHLYTKQLLHHASFTPGTFYSRNLTLNNFSTRNLLRQAVFTQETVDTTNVVSKLTTPEGLKPSRLGSQTLSAGMLAAKQKTLSLRFPALSCIFLHFPLFSFVFLCLPAVSPVFPLSLGSLEFRPGLLSFSSFVWAPRPINGPGWPALAGTRATRPTTLHELALLIDVSSPH